MIFEYPKISIVTPNYNQEHYLEQTITSVLDQNYPNLEYIIIDGGSTDGSIDIIKKYESQLKYWISESDNGMYDAIQKGFSKSTGEIMAWINSDDLYHYKSFFSVAEIFLSFKQVNWLTGIPTTFDELGRIVSVSNLKKWSKYDYYTRNFQWIQQESTFWRRDLWEKAGASMNTNLKFAGDFELWLRFFRHDYLFVTTAAFGGFRLRSCNQLSLDNFDNYLLEVETCLINEIISNYDQTILNEYYKAL